MHRIKPCRSVATRFLVLAVIGVLGSALPAEQELRQDDQGIELLSEGRPVLRYHTAVQSPPEAIDPVFSRSGFLHPVCTPSGRVVTADFPADHAHQHGIFAAWVNTTFEGRKVDFWNQAGRTGHVEHVRHLDPPAHGGNVSFAVELRHSDLTAPGGPRPVLRETWRVTLFPNQPEHVFDLESRQTCIAESPLTINEYHYGGMAFRGCSAWFSGEAKQHPNDFRFLTSEGLGTIEGNHTRPNWVAAGGTVDGAPCGIAVLAHPGNFRHPAPVRLHPTKPYFVFSPCVLGEFALDPGVEHAARYRYVVFDGPIVPARLDELWQAYAAAADNRQP
jgi:hypothetical protein